MHRQILYKGRRGFVISETEDSVTALFTPPLLVDGGVEYTLECPRSEITFLPCPASFTVLSFDDVLDLCDKLIYLIYNELEKRGVFDSDFLIVGVLRSGGIPALILSQLLEKKVDFVGVRFYEALGLHGKAPLLYRDVDDLPDVVVLVDDIVDSGATMSLLSTSLQKRCRELITASLLTKRSDLPEVFTKKVPSESWVVFPWDIEYRALMGVGNESC